MNLATSISFSLCFIPCWQSATRQRICRLCRQGVIRVGWQVIRKSFPGVFKFWGFASSHGLPCASMPSGGRWVKLQLIASGIMIWSREELATPLWFSEVSQTSFRWRALAASCNSFISPRNVNCHRYVPAGTLQIEASNCTIFGYEMRRSYSCRDFFGVWINLLIKKWKGNIILGCAIRI